MAAALAAGALLCGFAAPAAADVGVSKPQIERFPPQPRVVLAFLPSTTRVSDLARVSGLSLGVMSAGISSVPAVQTYLDIGQGNRVSPQLYRKNLPSAYRVLDFTDNHLKSVPGWPSVVKRADDAPADIEPGLLATVLGDARVPVQVERGVTDPALIAANDEGRVRWLPPQLWPCRKPLCPGVTVLRETLHNIRTLIGRLRGEDLLVALTTPPPHQIGTVPVGIAGQGFHGDLTSDSTRTNGYVLSTDIAPTILRRFELAIPDEIDGDPIRTEGEVHPIAVEDRSERMNVISNRRGPVVILCLVAWIVVAAAIALLVPAFRPRALAWLALAFAYMPLILLAGAALEPGAVAEGLMIGLGAAALAVLTVLVARGWWALVIACGVTVVAYAIDVVAGSGLTTLSLLGPNPVFGVRFYGIGNELEALIAVMVPVAVGAGLTAAGERWPISRRVALGAFLVAGGLAAVVFAAGRFGADVGAAIVLSVGAAVAAASLRGASFEAFARPGAQKPSKLLWAGHRIAAILGTALIALAAVALIDLISGGNAHLTRSVLDAGGTGDLADIAQRRLELSAHDFAQAAANPLFWLLIAGVAVALAQWRRIHAWLEPVPAARAGVIGACAAVAVGVLVNDSGATFLVLGSLALGATLAFAWAQAGTDP
jgi:hypothetical protein